MKFKFGLLPRVVLAIALGVACGFFLPGWATRIALTFNAIFGQFLGFAIPLLILGLVAPGIADLGRNAGRLLALTAKSADLDPLDLPLFEAEMFAKLFTTVPAAQPGTGTPSRATEATAMVSSRSKRSSARSLRRDAIRTVALPSTATTAGSSSSARS